MLQVQVFFEEPLLVSQSQFKDKIRVEVIDEYQFTAKETGQVYVKEMQEDMTFEMPK